MPQQLAVSNATETKCLSFVDMSAPRAICGGSCRREGLVRIDCSRGSELDCTPAAREPAAERVRQSERRSRVRDTAAGRPLAGLANSRDEASDYTSGVRSQKIRLLGTDVKAIAL